VSDQDPYERGFEVAQRRRVDLREPPPDVVRRPPRMSWKVVLGALAVVVLIAVGRGISARDATSLHASCTKAQLALGEKSVPSRGPQLLHWAATVPAGTRFLVAVDAAGHSGHAQQSPVQVMGQACLARGQFGVLVPPGHYTVALVQVGVTEQRLAARDVVITAR
jgi:hypothetical protein